MKRPTGFPSLRGERACPPPAERPSARGSASDERPGSPAAASALSHPAKASPAGPTLPTSPTSTSLSFPPKHLRPFVTDRLDQQALGGLAGHCRRSAPAPFGECSRESRRRPPNCLSPAWHERAEFLTNTVERASRRARSHRPRRLLRSVGVAARRACVRCVTLPLPGARVGQLRRNCPSPWQVVPYRCPG